MTDKAYIVANEQQEREVLEKLERDGFKWRSGKTPTEKSYLMEEPITFFVGDDNQLTFDHEVTEVYLAECEIVYDGRKEEHMSDKYVVSQEFMNELVEWKKRGNTDVYFVGSYDISMLPIDVIRWWDYPEINNFEQNNRLIAILRWVNGEDVFEVEKPKKWVVRSKDSNDVGEHRYLRVTYTFSIIHAEAVGDMYATKFNTKEEAESWANSHQEVIQVESE